MSNLSGLTGLLAAIAVLIFFEGVRRLLKPTVGTELPELFDDGTMMERRNSFIERNVLPSARILPARFGFLRGLTNPETISRDLQYAGRPYNMNAEEFFGFQLFSMVLGFFGGSLLMVLALITGLCNAQVAVLIGPIAGFFYPRLWLRQQVRKRQDRVSLGMPDMMDMLSISVQAGMGFDNALRLIVSNTTGPLSEEIGRLLRELDMGEPRASAFRALVSRNTSEDLRIFVDALLQSEELGTPLSKTLRIQAEDLRIRRVNRAKEKAAEASPKISLITVFLVAPATLILFITALILSMFFGGGFGFVSGG